MCSSLACAVAHHVACCFSCEAQTFNASQMCFSLPTAANVKNCLHSAPHFCNTSARALRINAMMMATAIILEQMNSNKTKQSQKIEIKHRNEQKKYKRIQKASKDLNFTQALNQLCKPTTSKETTYLLEGFNPNEYTNGGDHGPGPSQL